MLIYIWVLFLNDLYWIIAFTCKWVSLCMVLDWFYASPINEYFLLRVFSRIVLDESSLWLVDNESFLWLLLDLSSLMSSLIVCCRLAEWEGSSIHGISDWGPDSWGPGGSPKKIPPKGSHSLALKNCQVSFQFYHCWQSQDARNSVWSLRGCLP